MSIRYRQNIARRFYDWIKVKIYLDARNRKPYINEGEIWWASVGKNVGVEIDGKNSNFSRPVLILKKYNYHSFMAIPLTTKERKDDRYVLIDVGGRKSYGVLIQGRTMSASRLYRRICTIPRRDLEDITNKFCELHTYSQKNITPPISRLGGGAGIPEQ